METSITFDDLPPELQLLVFSFFNNRELNDTAAKVCTKWRHLCADPVLWKRISIHEQNSSDITRALNRNHFVRYVVLKETRDFNWINDIEKHASVQSIELWIVHVLNLTKPTMIRLTEKFPNVQSVNIINCRYSTLKFGCIASELADWKFLKSLDVRFMHHEDIWIHFPAFFKRIECLKHIGYYEGSPITNQIFQELIEVHGSHLEHIFLNFMLINSASFKLLSTRCVNLAHLGILFPNFITDMDLLSLQNSPSLKSLTIDLGQDSLPDLFIYHHFGVLFANATFEHLMALTVMSAGSFDDTALTAFVRCCPNLEDLTIINTHHVTNEGIKNLPLITTTLERLYFLHFDEITEDCLRETANQMKQLQYCVAESYHLKGGVEEWIIMDKTNSRKRLPLKKFLFHHNFLTYNNWN